MEERTPIYTKEAANDLRKLLARAVKLDFVGAIEVVNSCGKPVVEVGVQGRCGGSIIDKVRLEVDEAIVAK